jgi:hypothetical protein
MSTLHRDIAAYTIHVHFGIIKRWKPWLKSTAKYSSGGNPIGGASEEKFKLRLKINRLKNNEKCGEDRANNESAPAPKEGKQSEVGNYFGCWSGHIRC